MSEYTFKQKNSQYKIIIKAESEQKANEIYEELFEKHLKNSVSK
jgi:hypothetical protein